jgi:hypothetical protein
MNNTGLSPKLYEFITENSLDTFKSILLHFSQFFFY